MRTVLSVLAGALCALNLTAADTDASATLKTNAAPQKIGAQDAANYYDKEMIVTGRVAQVTVRPTVTFLNLDKPFPDSPFTVVVFPAKSDFKGDLKALDGKVIELKGKIRNYKDKPEIVLDYTNQLTVLGMTNLDIIVTPPPSAKPPAEKPAPASEPTNFPEIM